MRKLRLLLLLLLALAIPLQGWAGARVFALSCPMTQSMAAGMVHMEHDADSVSTMPHASHMHQQTANADDSGNCHDDPAAGNASKMCKAGQDCPLSAQYPASPSTTFFFPVEGASQFPPLEVSVLSFDVSSVWRPPARA